MPPDGLNAWLEGKGRRRSVVELPRLVAAALRLVLGAARPTFLVVSGLHLLSAALLALQLVVGKAALEALLLAPEAPELSVIAPPLLGLAAVTAALSLTGAAAGQLQRLLNERVLRAAWDEVLTVTSSVPLETYEQPEFFEELHRVEVAAIQRPLDIARALVALLSGAAGVVVLAVVLVRLDPVLPLVLVLAAPALWLVTRRRSRHEYEFVRRQAVVHRQRNYLRGSLTDRALAKEVRAFDLAPTLLTRYQARYAHYLDGLRRLVRQQLRLAVVEALLSSLVLAGTLLVLVLLVVSARVDLAEAAVAAVTIRLLSSRISGLNSGMGQLYESALFVEDLQRFRARASRVRPADGPSAEALRTLAVQDVSFTYGGKDEPALRGVNLEIQQGEVVALVGENGSGKTTLAKIVAQLLEPDAGRVVWNGVECAVVDAASLRRQVAVIFQDYAQWELSAYDNIALGAGGPEDEAGVLRAAEGAGADAFLLGLPSGLDTVLSTSYVGGTQLSVGQWQRVALARALYRKASLLVLDEPSAALDPRAEADLFSRLREIAGGRSVLFISHRFSSVRSADRIYVLRRGEVVEQGDHDSLMALGGTYAELFRLQAAAYLDAEAEPAAVGSRSAG